MQSLWKRRIYRTFLVLGFAAANIPQPVMAQTAQSLPAALIGIAPLADQAMRHVSGMGLLLAKASPASPSTGNVVLWDEIAKNPGNVPKSIPGFRVTVTVNGVPQ